MSKTQERLIHAYTILVLAERRTIDEVPTTVVTLDDSTESTIQREVEIAVAEREVEVLS